jgi:hypothetical protein
MSKHLDRTDEKYIESAKIKNEYIESLKDQIQMLQEQVKSQQLQHETAQNRLMSMLEQTQRLLEM